MKENTTVSPGAGTAGAHGFAAGRTDPDDAALLLAPCDEPPLVAGRRGIGEMLLDIAVAADDMTS